MPYGWRWPCLLISVLSAILPGASAQVQQFEGRTIVDIQYQPAEQPLAQPDLDRVQTLKKGAPLHLAEVATVIDNLYATGRYDDIQVDAEPSGDGVTLRFITTFRWFNGHITMLGKFSEPPNRGQLANATLLNLGMPFQESELKSAQEHLKKLLGNNGLYEASFDMRTERDAKYQQVNFVLTLKSGKRAKYEMPLFQGDTKMSESALIRATGWRIPLIHWWRQVTQTKTRSGLDGIRKKYAKQDRLTASVKLDKLDYDASRRRVKANLDITAGPKVKVQAIEAKVSKGKLKKYVPIYEEGAVDRDLLVEGARNLRDYFQGKGYYDVTVDFKQLPPQDDELTIQYIISRGLRYKLVKVEFEGYKYFTADAFRERIFLQPASLALRHGRYSEQFRKNDEEAIQSLYASNGFRDAKVTSTVVNPYMGRIGEIAVTFHIDEGPQWFVDSLDIQGMQGVGPDRVQGDLSSFKNQPFSDVSIAADRNAILSYYYLHGFPKAAFQYSYTPSSAPNHINLKYVISEGPHQFINAVEISGLKATREGLVDRQLKIKAGDDLSPLALTAAQKRLYDLGVFAKVSTAIQNPDGDTDYKNVLFDFEEANRYLLKLGIGAELAQFGTTTNNITTPGGSTSFTPIFSVDLTRLNFRGTGQSVSLDLRYADFDKRASVNYIFPRFMNVDGRNITYSVLYDDSRDVRTFASKREEGSVQVSQKFSKATTGLFRFSYRRVSTSNVIIPSLLVPQLLQPVRLGLLGMNLAQDKRDDPTDPHRGIYSSIDIGLASKFFGGQRSFGRVLLRNATYHRITHNVILARQTEFGVIAPFSPPAGLSAAESVPLPERFFGGGETTDRGFPFNQAGPRDIGVPAGPGAPATQPTGFPLGGNALLFNNVELRFPLIGSNIGGALFWDAGNVYSSFHDISFSASQKNLQDFNYMVHAVGVGIRYRTPVGPIRVDLAYSVNPPSFVGFSGTVAQLLLCNPNPAANMPNPSYCTPVQQNVSHFQFFFTIGQSF